MEQPRRKRKKSSETSEATPHGQARAAPAGRATGGGAAGVAVGNVEPFSQTRGGLTAPTGSSAWPSSNSNSALPTGAAGLVNPLYHPLNVDASTGGLPVGVVPGREPLLDLLQRVPLYNTNATRLFESRLQNKPLHLQTQRQKDRIKPTKKNEIVGDPCSAPPSRGAAFKISNKEAKARGLFAANPALYKPSRGAPARHDLSPVSAAAPPAPARSAAAAAGGAVAENVYLPLHELWLQYFRRIAPPSLPTAQRLAAVAQAELHGARLVVSSSRCPSYVGIQGFVLQETEQVRVEKNTLDDSYQPPIQ
eukprot:GHVT01073032.1.p1 GENE.GHVT01073032.1~~GHVT01073032.1.p1  ORF type:complete len:307 (+),score=67.07 GHVT01073032.1:548-1468(+)